MAIKFAPRQSPGPSADKAVKAAPATGVKPAADPADTDLFKESAATAPRKGRKKK
jgi:hypothetical protein